MSASAQRYIEEVQFILRPWRMCYLFAITFLALVLFGPFAAVLVALPTIDYKSDR